MSERFVLLSTRSTFVCSFFNIFKIILFLFPVNGVIKRFQDTQEMELFAREISPRFLLKNSERLMKRRRNGKFFPDGTSWLIIFHSLIFDMCSTSLQIIAIQTLEITKKTARYDKQKLQEVCTIKQLEQINFYFHIFILKTKCVTMNDHVVLSRLSL